MMCFTGLSAIPASADQTFYDNKTGNEDGYAYELWKDTGNTRMTITGGGSFSCEWSNINNCLFRKGQKFDCTQTYQQLGDIAIDYAVDFQPNGNSYMCVYGWTRNPLVEYYIVESWGDWRPPGQAASLGTVYTDGGAYDIYKTTRYNQPSIDGDTTFDQYWSVRQSKPQGNGSYIEGTISVSEHFKAWEKAGLRMGKMYEVALNIEGYRSSGKATVYGNNLRIGKSSGNNNNSGNNNSGNNNSGTSSPALEGTLYTGTFESGTDHWKARGSANIASSSSKAFEGSKSLYISGRQQNWNGAELALDSTYFKAGNAYSFSTMVMPASTTNVQLSMQYDQNGSTKYAQVASAKASGSSWTKLENSNFTIPAGASNCVLYVEAPDSLTDIYIDRAICASAGYKAADGSSNSGSSSSNTNTGNNNSGNNNSGNNNSGSTSSAETGNLFTSTFENGTDYWKARGSANAAASSSKAYAGSKSLYISGRQQNWNGAEISLDGDYFKAGSTYAFSTEVMTASTTNVQLSLQYDQNGSTKYAQVASAKASAGKWTKLENKEYTIPAGASNCVLYVEAPDSLTDFYIDQATGSTVGSANSGSSNVEQQANGYYIDPSKPMVAIAFDDGTSSSDSAYRIIDTLAANDFRATFFYVGNWINDPDEVRYAHSKGMEIANHTTSHANLTQLDQQQIRSEYDNTYNKLKNIIGAEPSKLLRLPYLASNWQVQQALGDVPMITCSIDTQDWNGASASQIIGTIQNAANNGSLNGAIVLCHETYNTTADAMGYVIPWLKQNGYQVVTISDMFAAKGQSLNGGQVYTKAS
ncbi:glycoside hydrolase family 11 protein [Ruminococcus sp.]|uniref:glycoside hydrolase family 11 protein n=1 Tax=Ruminococcus sp. TaxID=41978 RepID=UPI0025FE8B65|nr:glycoside hydrolase family 11 protein [Ruminococcus sp.]